MSSKENEIQEHYTKNLKAADYVDSLKKAFDDSPQLIRFVLTFWYDALKSGRFGGSSVLEIGSGALVHNIASASAFYSNIVMSDYVEDNCNELKMWLKGKTSIHQFLDVPAELEAQGRDLETVKKSIEERIKANVKHVVRCDVLIDGILMEKLPLHSSPPYDLIISSFCLETAAVDIKSYIQIYKRINKLLRPGGGLMICGLLRGKLWNVKDIVYHHFDIGQDDLLNSLKESGFGEIDIKTLDKMHAHYKYDKIYCVAATKVK